MNEQTMPELISFKVCPFVQRSAITLNEKQVKFKTTYVDLQDLPDWFHAISPLGKVPVLKAGETVVFESAVIAEYLDECYAPQLHPEDLLKKAQNRSWTEFASDITMNMFQMLHADTEEDFNALKNKVIEQFTQVEKVLDAEGPFFNGADFSLVDAAYAPVFLRLRLIDAHLPLEIIDGSERIQNWSKALLEKESVKTSVVDDFEEIFMAYVEGNGGYLAMQLLTQ